MKISLLQMDVILGHPSENRQKVEKMFRQTIEDDPDVIVLPETWNTGFFPENVKELADLQGEPSCSLLSELAMEYKVNIIGGSIADNEKGKVYNTNYVFDRNGRMISKYRKIHLFSPSGEHNFFEPGNEISIYEIDGVKAATIICYDLRFAELVRTLALEGIQILFVPAEWPHPRLEHWKTLLKARAVENQMFVVGVNGVGKAKELKFCGNSMIIDPWGEVIACAGEEEGVITGELDLSIIHDIRERINVFRDRRPGIYKI
ncbi:MAG: carbon-nitrogen family hydrolase [Firmicutes bacterium]|nr:carbon-nitrogen family hydrolase [Bacillota bacterium]